MPTPLLPTSISLVLEYIAPPSLLSPLPPHLISDALSQRHRFLHITPDDPQQYLAWPSDQFPSAQQSAVDLLESFQKLLHDPVYTVRYTTDPESSFAHAAISTQNPPGLRLVFQWASDGWRFHNLALMPFPPNAYDSLEEMFTSKPHDFLDQPSIADGDDGRDSYWDAYGLSDDSDDQLGTGRPKVEHDTGTEDAYWAQYSAVHGSGDSARPTPPTVNQRLDSERVILAYPHHRTSSAYNPLAPPSPKALASLLADLPPRTPSPIFDDSDSGFGSASASGSASPPILSSPDINSSDAPSALLSAATYTPLLQVDSGSPVNEHPLAEDLEAQNAVKDTIRGVYRLWRARRVTGSPTFDGDHDEFLGIVRQALS